MKQETVIETGMKTGMKASMLVEFENNAENNLRNELAGEPKIYTQKFHPGTGMNHPTFRMIHPGTSMSSTFFIQANCRSLQYAMST